MKKNVLWILAAATCIQVGCGTGRAVGDDDDSQAQQGAAEAGSKDEQQQVIDNTFGRVSDPLGPTYLGVAGRLQSMTVRNYVTQADGTLAPSPTDVYKVTLRIYMTNLLTKIPVCIDIEQMTWEARNMAMAAENAPTRVCALPDAKMVMADVEFTISVPYVTPERVGQAIPTGHLTGDGVDLTHAFTGCLLTRVDTARNFWSVQCR